LGRNNKQLTTEEFIEHAKKVHGDKYGYEKVFYQGRKEKVTITCLEHGDFKQLPNNHIYLKYGCPKCSSIKIHKNNILTTEQFIKKAILIHGDKYDYGKIIYKKHDIEVIIICPEHGDFKQVANNHLNGSGCPKCAGNIKFNKDTFIERARLVHGDKYNYSKVEYKNSKIKVIIVCYKHGEFLQTPDNQLRGRGCLICGESSGEKLIKRYLYQNNINFVPEKSFSDLRGIGGGLLRYDFYLPDFNICIEYDGPQHFSKKYCEKNYGTYKSNYNTLKFHDRKKSRYCKKHGIKLIRIPYYYKSKIKEIINFNLLIKKVA
jgi:hypothetical protein